MTKKSYSWHSCIYILAVEHFPLGNVLPFRAASGRWVAESTERAMPDADFGSETGSCRSRLTAGIVV